MVNKAYRALTKDRLDDVVSYNKADGNFYWKKQLSSRCKIGEIAGRINMYGYRVIKIDGKNYPAHRLVFLHVNGSIPKECVDHINHNRIDNRFENLRQVSDSENKKNRPLAKHNTSGVNGVTFNKKYNKWCAQMVVNSKHIHIGYFDSIEQAEKARLAANDIHGFHKNHGKSINHPGG